MWQKLAGLRRQFPWDIISPLLYLEYGATTDVTLLDGTQMTTPIGTPRFCDRLTELALGGPWGSNLELLALFLRYAVACCINDHRPMPFLVGPVDGGGEFFRLMHKKLGKARQTRKSIPRIHKEMRRIFRRQGLPLPWHSNMLRNLGKLAYRPSNNEPFGGDQDLGSDFQPYRVTTEDLHRVERAVSSCTDLDRSLFRSVKDSAQIVSHGRTYDFPEHYEEV